MLTTLTVLTCSTYHSRIRSGDPPLGRRSARASLRRSLHASCRTPARQSLARTTSMRTCATVLPKVLPHHLTIAPRLVIPARPCLCLPVPSHTPSSYAFLCQVRGGMDSRPRGACWQRWVSTCWEHPPQAGAGADRGAPLRPSCSRSTPSHPSSHPSRRQRRTICRRALARTTLSSTSG
jgi:hypothetical protein